MEQSRANLAIVTAWFGIGTGTPNCSREIGKVHEYRTVNVSMHQNSSLLVIPATATKIKREKRNVGESCSASNLNLVTIARPSLLTITIPYYLNLVNLPSLRNTVKGAVDGLEQSEYLAWLPNAGPAR